MDERETTFPRCIQTYTRFEEASKIVGNRDCRRYTNCFIILFDRRLRSWRSRGKKMELYTYQRIHALLGTMHSLVYNLTFTLCQTLFVSRRRNNFSWLFSVFEWVSFYSALYSPPPLQMHNFYFHILLHFRLLLSFSKLAFSPIPLNSFVRSH